MSNLELLLSGNVEALKAEVDRIDLTAQTREMPNPEYRGYLGERAGMEHYKLLAWISQTFAGQTIYEIGTAMGNSSLALSYSPTTKIISYDIKVTLCVITLPENVEYKIGDFRQDPDVLKAPFIFIDVDPHDGIQEQAFHEFLLANNYKGIVMWDDILRNDQGMGMSQWWDSVTEPNVKKLDLSAVGHITGTGLMIYS